MKFTGIIALALILTAGGAAAQERITPEMGAAMNGGGTCHIEGSTLVCQTTDGSKVCRQDDGGDLSCQGTAGIASPEAGGEPGEREHYTPPPHSPRAVSDLRNAMIAADEVGNVTLEKMRERRGQKMSGRHKISPAVIVPVDAAAAPVVSKKSTDFMDLNAFGQFLRRMLQVQPKYRRYSKTYGPSADWHDSRECQRRRRQIAAGQLKVENGLSR